MVKAATTEEYARRLAKVDQAIEQNLDAPLSPQQLAKVAAFAPHHFHRIFRAQRGETVMQRVRRLRLLRAAKALTFSSASVLEVALAAGYSSHEAFTRAFTEHFGCTPSAYRATPTPRIEEFLQRTDAAAIPEVEIRPLASLRVASLRHTGPFADVGSAFGALTGWAISNGLWPRRHVGLCPDDPDLVATDQLRMDACVVLEDDDTFPATTNLPVVERTVASGRYAIALHRGSYATLSETYLGLIGHWLPTTRELPTDAPILERYLNDPTQTKEADLLTEVCLPLSSS